MPEDGRAATISASICMKQTVMNPAMTYAISTAGPAAAIPTPVPRNRPAPMAEPRPIMVRWRVFSPRASAVDSATGETGVDMSNTLNASYCANGIIFRIFALIDA